MKEIIAIVDYGLGNLHSVAKALRLLGCDFLFAENPQQIHEAARVILPGVGAFGDGMAGLQRCGHDEALLAFAATGRPLLGICLGAQLLLDESTEFGNHPGLGIISGKVAQIPHEKTKVPHVGWQRLVMPQPEAWINSPLAQTPEGTHAYFVHSYHAIPADPAHLLAVADYHGNQVTAGVGRGNVFGFQFHPEKSGQLGLNMLRSFLAIDPL